MEFYPAMKKNTARDTCSNLTESLDKSEKSYLQKLRDSRSRSGGGAAHGGYGHKGRQRALCGDGQVLCFNYCWHSPVRDFVSQFHETLLLEKTRDVF